MAADNQSKCQQLSLSKADACPKLRRSAAACRVAILEWQVQADSLPTCRPHICVEQVVGQRLAQLRLAHTRGPQEHEGRDGALGI